MSQHERNDPPMGCFVFILLIIIAAFGAFSLMNDEIIPKMKEDARKGREERANAIKFIEGEVASVEMKKVPDPFDEKDENGKPKKGIFIRFESHEPDRTVVKFADGREKEFVGIPEKPIPKVYVVIEYDGNNRIKTVTPKEQ